MPKKSQRKPSKKNKRPGAVDRTQRMNHQKAQALASLAQTTWERHRSYLSVALLTDAVRREPQNVKLIVDLAMVHGRRRDYDLAEKLLERASRLSTRKAAFQRMIGQTYAYIDRPVLAIECYLRALNLNSDAPTTTQTLVELAQLYERGHQLNEAGETIGKALARDPLHESARFQQALLARRHGDLEQAESQLRALVGEKPQSTQVHSDAWYELAQLLDKQGCYDEAFEAFISAKELLRPAGLPYEKASHRTLLRMEETLAELSEDHFQKWRNLAENDKPLRCALLTGHPRSGTTLVEQVLDSHDELISADEFDVFFEWITVPISQKFPPTTSVLDALQQVPEAVRQQARQTYWDRSEAIFDESIGERILLDKNPAMTSALPIVSWAFPEMKLLIALRDPRDVVLSCFMQRLPLNEVSANWLSLDQTSRYYAATMKTWLAVRELTNTQWIEFKYEDCVDNLEQQARRILEFLGLPWNEKVLKFHEHASKKRVRSPTYEAVTKPIYGGSVGRWQYYARHFEPLAEVLDPFVKEFGYS